MSMVLSGSTLASCGRFDSFPLSPTPKSVLLTEPVQPDHQGDWYTLVDVGLVGFIVLNVVWRVKLFPLRCRPLSPHAKTAHSQIGNETLLKIKSTGRLV